ncbi:MAG: acyltransferase family protein [Rhodospirillaceae bacterium]|nr:acyltransferase family protein [Rhodospirillaceae bacterium]
MPRPTSGIAWHALDSLRGIFALWVALGHAYQWLQPITKDVPHYIPFLARPSHAVPLFCVLSGMLVARSLGDSFDIAGLRRYFIRRIVRI